MGVSNHGTYELNGRRLATPQQFCFLGVAGAYLSENEAG